MIYRGNVSQVTDSIFIGNLKYAHKIQLKDNASDLDDLGITHILSMCPDFPSTGKNHSTIPVSDESSEDILIQLPAACKFIEDAVVSGGKVLVHCVMGISRSVTAVCAYLMKSRGIRLNEALLIIKKRRPQIHPNPGFLKQLQFFEDMNYEVLPTDPIYLEFRQMRATLIEGENDLFTATCPLELELPTRICDNIYICEELPEILSLKCSLNITHILLISPTQQALYPPPSVSDNTRTLELAITDVRLESLLVHLGQACDFIEEGVDSGGNVLIHSLLETRTSQAMCAYFMRLRHITVQTAFSLYETARPLFDPSPTFFTQLEVFESCEYNPTADSPKVLDWVERNSPTNSRRSSGINMNGGKSGNNWGRVGASIRANWSA